MADVADEGVVAPASFDCAIVAADLGERLDAAMARIWDGLVGGGVLLVDRRRAVKPA